MKAILVLGPESSGTRLMTRLLIGCGCDGDGDHHQRFDRELPPPGKTIVWRRSVPYGGFLPDLKGMVDQLREKGYSEIAAVVMMRDWYPTAMSQIANHCRDCDLKRAMDRVRDGLLWIFRFLIESGIRFVVVNYEALIQRPGDVMRWVCRELGIPFKGVSEPLRDENAKWYEGRR